MPNEAIPGPAKILGVAGLLPFISASLLVFLLPDSGRQMAFDVLVHYAAVILSFLGAVHWGLTMCRLNQSTLMFRDIWIGFGWGVTPALIAWIATQMVLTAALITLIAGFSAAFVVDVWSKKKSWIPEWYLKLRKPLTLIVLICLGAALLNIRI
ncbi:MAG: DUF3429 domain-containing protein [Rhodospirillaceae bacterium]|nr:DUF3429 domain-containing protein [Rhodospirillaceae bacterium]|tara:strand:- start:219 stop:680 length:462 start_codon:yes stop_codon:yes gene_type:complete